MTGIVTEKVEPANSGHRFIRLLVCLLFSWLRREQGSSCVQTIDYIPEAMSQAP